MSYQPRQRGETAESPTRRILIIEDDADVAESLKDVLELRRHEVAIACNGSEGLAKAREWLPEFIFCDIGLPGMDGYAVGRELRADERLRGTVLVAVSGYALPDDRKRAVEAGFHHHMAKPPDLERVEELLGRGPTAAPHSMPPASARRSAEVRTQNLEAGCSHHAAAIQPVADEGPDKRLRVLLVEDNPGDAELVREVLEEYPGRWHIKHVSRLAECLAVLREVHSVDVVILDLSLPDASGLEGVTALFRSRPDVPVVVLTGLGDAELGARAVQQGAQEYLVKGELLGGRTLDRVLRYAVERHALAQHAQLLAREHATRVAADAARRRAMLLADASIAIASTLDEEEVIGHLTRVLVPRFAKFCALERLDSSYRAHCLLASVGDDGMRRELERHATEAEAAVHLRARCSLGARLLEATIPEPFPPWREAWEQVQPELALGSAMILPLTIRGEPLGVLMLATSERYEAEDLTLAEEIARRAAAGVDGARLYQQALEAVQVRDDFISMAGHELRTPLMSLLLDVRRLTTLQTPDAETLHQGCDRIARCGERLRNLIGDLLDVSRIRAGRFPLELSQVDLLGLVKEVVERHAAQLGRISLRLVPSDLPPIAGRWDRSRIEQVIANLLQNAIRYGRGEPIEIALERENGVARLRVRDHGNGIDPRDQARIFEQFAHASATSRKEGLGLGLWITKGIVEAHGGAISVHSELGQGAEFRVELPCAGPPADSSGGA